MGTRRVVMSNDAEAGASNSTEARETHDVEAVTAGSAAEQWERDVVTADWTIRGAPHRGASARGVAVSGPSVGPRRDSLLTGISPALITLSVDSGRTAGTQSVTSHSVSETLRQPSISSNTASTTQSEESNDDKP